MAQGKLVPFGVREQLKADKAAGKTVRQIAEEKNLNKDTVQKWLKPTSVQHSCNRKAT